MLNVELLGSGLAATGAAGAGVAAGVGAAGWALAASAGAAVLAASVGLGFAAAAFWATDSAAGVLLMAVTLMVFSFVCGDE
jgi:hypothetical protein